LAGADFSEPEIDRFVMAITSFEASAASARAVAFSAGGDGGGRSPELPASPQ
jgi:hypothetical protein